LSPKGEFWNRLERALDLSKNVSEPAKNDLGNSPFGCKTADPGIGWRKMRTQGFLDGSKIIDPEKLIFYKGFGKYMFFDKIETKGKFDVKSPLPS